MIDLNKRSVNKITLYGLAKHVAMLIINGSANGAGIEQIYKVELENHRRLENIGPLRRALLEVL